MKPHSTHKFIIYVPRAPAPLLCLLQLSESMGSTFDNAFASAWLAGHVSIVAFVVRIILFQINPTRVWVLVCDYISAAHVSPLCSLLFFDAMCSVFAPTYSLQQPGGALSLSATTLKTSSYDSSVGKSNVAGGKRTTHEERAAVNGEQRTPPPPPPPPRSASWNTRRKSLEGCNTGPAPVSFRERSASKASRHTSKSTCFCLTPTFNGRSRLLFPFTRNRMLF